MCAGKQIARDHTDHCRAFSPTVMGATVGFEAGKCHCLNLVLHTLAAGRKHQGIKEETGNRETSEMFVNVIQRGNDGDLNQSNNSGGAEKRAASKTSKSHSG